MTCINRYVNYLTIVSDLSPIEIMKKTTLMQNSCIICIVACLITFSGGINSGVLCFGSDGHMHIESTFNGVDCGHHALSPVKANDLQHLTVDSLVSSAPCYSCTDIPLAFPRYLFEQSSYARYPDNNKTASILVLPSASSQHSLQGMLPDSRLKVPIRSHRTLSDILSISLRM